MVLVVKSNERSTYATVPDSLIQQYCHALGAPVGEYDVCECCCCHSSSDKLDECAQVVLPAPGALKRSFCLLGRTTYRRTVTSFIVNVM